jgi:glycosyltransferase involved in cell wall biosynthesis
MAYFSIFTKIFTYLVDKVLILTTVEKSPITKLYVDSYGLPINKIGEELHGCKFNPISLIEEKVAKVKLGLEGYKVILSFGFIRRDKGFEYLIDAYSQISKENYLLVIAGSPKSRDDEDYLDYLIKFSESLGIRDRVIFKSKYLTDDELKDYIDAADIIVLPYLRNVGASGPLHYALSRGKLVVVTNVGYMSSMKDIIVVVQPKDSNGLADAIIKLLEDGEFAEKIRSCELEYAKAHDWSRIINHNLNVYKSIVGKYKKSK